MKRFLITLVVVLIITFFSSNVFAEDNLIPEPPVIVTTCGQSPGALMVKLISQRIGLECEHDDLLTVEGLKNKPYKTLIITMGTSVKGMGAAGTDINDEVIRINALVEEARKQQMVIIGAHIEGMARRVDKYDEKSIDTVAPISDIIIVKADSDSDGFFTKLTQEKTIPLYTIEETLDLQQLLKELFKIE